MNLELFRAQLHGMRAQLDAMHATVDVMVIALNGQTAPAEGPPPGACPSCGAPEAKQVDAGTLNNPGLQKCLSCGGEYAGR